MGHELGAHAPAHNRLGARRSGMLPGTQVGIEQLIRRLSEGHRLLDCPRHSGLLVTGDGLGAGTAQFPRRAVKVPMAPRIFSTCCASAVSGTHIGVWVASTVIRSPDPPAAAPSAGSSGRGPWPFSS